MFQPYELAQLVNKNYKPNLTMESQIEKALNEPKTVFEASLEVGCNETTIRKYIRANRLQRKVEWKGTQGLYLYCNKWK